jgi:lipopolysaccharide transport system permease protein
VDALIRSRSVLWLLVKRELRARYAGSVLGSVWNIIQPLFLIGIYVLVFSSVMHRAGGGTRGGYVVHLCAGLIPWLVFSETLQRCTGILAENANFLKKLTFPHEILHFSVLAHALVIHFISLVGLLVLLMLFGAPLGREVLLAFPLLAGIGLVAAGLGMVLSVLNLLLRDIGPLTTLLLQAWFWLTPIVYVPAILPGGAEGWVFRLLQHSPILGYISATQAVFGSPQAYFHDDSIYVMVLLPFAAIWIGREVLRRQRAELLDLL